MFNKLEFLDKVTGCVDFDSNNASFKDDFSLAGWELLWPTYTKFKVSICTRYEDTKSGTKCRVMGHSRSSAMSQFSKTRTTSYSTFNRIYASIYLLPFSRYS